MTKRKILFFITTLCYSLTVLSSECVVLLHGLGRTASSMEKLEYKLDQIGFIVVNIDYPSKEMPIEELSEIAVSIGLNKCKEDNASPINFVTHSLGGILVRQYFKNHDPKLVKRTVMLAPPNKGSLLVDKLNNIPGFEFILGPALMQLGSGTLSVPNTLGPTNFALGIIAGTRSINPILSTMLPSPDDGKVSVESTRLEGMSDHISMPVTHTFMMRNNKVLAQVIHFLKYGAFKRENEKT